MSVAPWISVLSWHIIHKDGDIFQIYFCVIFREKGTMHRLTPHVVHCVSVSPFFGRKKNTDSSADRFMILLASVCYGYFFWGLLLLLFLLFFFLRLVFNIASLCTWFQGHVSNHNFTDGFLLEFYFFPGHGSETYNRLPCLHYIWLSRVTETLYIERYKSLVQWQ